ncbi:MAG: hypothetical protein ACAH21_11240 [Ramlibacter sp.]|nr:hypothetical protein [Ramlibacter sp.]
MGITLFTFGGMLAPLQGLMGWLASRPRQRTPARQAPLECRQVARVTVPCPVPTARRNEPMRRPLRVVRVVDAPATRAGAGRMFMSGRMADVCAELDRLAALEAATH